MQGYIAGEYLLHCHGCGQCYSACYGGVGCRTAEVEHPRADNLRSSVVEGGQEEVLHHYHVALIFSEPHFLYHQVGGDLKGRGHGVAHDGVAEEAQPLEGIKSPLRRLESGFRLKLFPEVFTRETCPPGYELPVGFTRVIDVAVIYQSNSLHQVKRLAPSPEPECPAVHRTDTLQAIDVNIADRVAVRVDLQFAHSREEV